MAQTHSDPSAPATAEDAAQPGERRRQHTELAAIGLIGSALARPGNAGFDGLGRVSAAPPLLAGSLLVTATGLLTGNGAMARSGARMIAAHGLARALSRLGPARPVEQRPGSWLSRRPEPDTIAPAGTRRAFPSGRTAGAFVLARAAAREYAGRGAFYGTAALLGTAQVLRRTHFLGDVVVGAALGLAAEAALHAVLRPVLGPRRARRISRRG